MNKKMLEMIEAYGEIMKEHNSARREEYDPLERARVQTKKEQKKYKTHFHAYYDVGSRSHVSTRELLNRTYEEDPLKGQRLVNRSLRGW